LKRIGFVALARLRRGSEGIRREWRERAVKIEIIAARKLVRARRLQRTPSLIRPDLCVASDGWPQIAQRICFAFLEFSVALVNLQILRPNRLMADRTHLSCFTISAASCNRLRYAREHKRERDGSNGNTMRQPSLGAWLRHHGFLFNSHEYQLHGGRTVPENSGAFWEEERRVFGPRSRQRFRLFRRMPARQRPFVERLA
jgi:hypothetical protein